MPLLGQARAQARRFSRGFHFASRQRGSWDIEDSDEDSSYIDTGFNWVPSSIKGYRPREDSRVTRAIRP